MKKLSVAVLLLVIALSASGAGAADKCNCPCEKKETANKYTVTIDYSQSIKQMIAAGRYGWNNSDIIEKNFPIPSSKRGKEEVVIELVPLDRDMGSDEVLRKLNKMGLRPAELPELLAFGATYPGKQREFPIAALGSTLQDREGFRYAVYLGEYSDERYLYLLYFGHRWDSFYRFVAVRK